jgi:predicted nucleotidyltransferase component of viral defense system
MKPLRTRLLEARKRLGLPWEALERDYLLSWVLTGIGQVDSLRETLVFKGGTALKKCYFGDYRFSEDLDFSGLEGVPTGEAMERAVREAAVRRRSCWTSTPPWRSPASATRRRTRIREARKRLRSARASPGRGSLKRAS